MGEEREFALGIALKSLLATAKKQGVDLEALAGGAAEALIVDRAYGSWYVSQAILERERSMRLRWNDHDEFTYGNAP